MAGSHVINERPAISIGRQGLKPLYFRSADVAAEAATHKDHLRDNFLKTTSERQLPMPWTRGVTWPRNLTMTKLPHGLAHFAFGLFVFFGLAAIPFLLALGQGEFTLGDSFLEINAQRDERQAPLVGL